jgi:hypothetical protein
VAVLVKAELVEEAIDDGPRTTRIIGHPKPKRALQEPGSPDMTMVEEPASESLDRLLSLIRTDPRTAQLLCGELMSIVSDLVKLDDGSEASHFNRHQPVVGMRAERYRLVYRHQSVSFRGLRASESVPDG